MRLFALGSLISFLLLLFSVTMFCMFLLSYNLILLLRLSYFLLPCMSPLIYLENFLTLYLILSRNLLLCYLKLTAKLFSAVSSLRKFLLLGILISVELLFCEIPLRLARLVGFENSVTCGSAPLMLLVFSFRLLLFHDCVGLGNFITFEFLIEL